MFNPTPAELAEIAIMSADAVKRFDIVSTGCVVSFSTLAVY